MNTFLTSYQKNKGGVSVRSSNQPPQNGTSLAHEVIKEADSSGVSNTVVGEGDSLQSSMPQRASKEGPIKIDVKTKEGFKDLIRW
jgi:hypothetical protein